MFTFNCCFIWKLKGNLSRIVQFRIDVLLKIIKGEGTWAQNAVVFANAAMALQCSGNFASYDKAYAAAVQSLESGKAYESLQKLISLQ